MWFVYRFLFPGTLVTEEYVLICINFVHNQVCYVYSFECKYKYLKSSKWHINKDRLTTHFINLYPAWCLIPSIHPHSMAGWRRFPDVLHCHDGKADCSDVLYIFSVRMSVYHAQQPYPINWSQAGWIWRHNAHKRSRRLRSTCPVYHTMLWGNLRGQVAKAVKELKTDK